MKKYTIFILCLNIIFRVSAQQSVGINTTTPHPNASLDISGVNKGLLIPRGDAGTRIVLSTNSAKGLMMYDTTTSTIWVHNGNGNANGWQSLSNGLNHWKLSGALGTEIKNTNPDGFWSAYATTVLSDPGLVSPPVSGPGTRFMWIPQKSAFRVGTTDAGHWDAENIGLFSFAGGLNTIANHSYSFAMGAGTSSKALAATSMGWFTNATGQISTAMGFKTRSKSYASLAIGRFNDSISISNNSTWINSDPLFMIGNGASESTRHNAMVVYKNGNAILKNPQAFYYTKLPSPYLLPVEGEGTRMMWLPEISAFRAGTVTDTAWNSASIGVGSFAVGLNSMARGGISMATGYDTKASGEVSTAMGRGNIAKGYSSLAIGHYNEPILTIDQDVITSTTPLFMIGNGDGEAARHNAMVVYKNGNILSKNPVIVDGSVGAFDMPVSGAGTRLMWLPTKSAFRVGTVEGDQWDSANMGTWSFASGLSTKASASTSFAAGQATIASAIASAAFGQFSVASGVTSFATGYQTNASGPQSTAMGFQNAARAHYTLASGNNNIAKGFSSTVIGMYNDSIFTANQTVVSPTTPLFIVGNGDGAGSGQRKNAMVVRKDGRVGISTNAPATKLVVVGAFGLPSIPGISSTGIMRIGVSDVEGIDFGKMSSPSYAGWIQAGFNGSGADPLSLQPSGGSVGIGTTGPVSSAALDVSSTTKGFLPPRMLLSERNGIAAPVAGLIIWCTNCSTKGEVQVFNGSTWTNLSGSPAHGVPVIGARDGGGIIAYLLQPGDPGFIPGEIHGLIAASIDQSAGSSYGCGGTLIPGADGVLIGTGNQNTIDIMAGCISQGIAARLCGNLYMEGFSDWFLPSKDELNKLYLNQSVIGEFYPGFYWSSSEFSSTNAWTQDFSTGLQASQSKNTPFYVRAIRSF